MKKVTKQVFIDAVKWKTVNLVLSRGVSVFVSIMLARMLNPSDYGLMTIWTVFLSLGTTLVVGGLDIVFVQKETLQETDWTTGLTSSLIRATVLYFLFFAAAPSISSYYRAPRLSSIIRIVAIDFFCQAFIAIGLASTVRKMDFKTIFFCDWLSAIGGAVAAFTAFYLGYSGYCLAINALGKQLLYALFLMSRFRVTIRLSDLNFQRFKESSNYGYRVMFSSMLDLTASSVSGLIAGKYWTSSELGYVNRAEKVTNTAGVESYGLISNLLLPTLSSYQSDRKALKALGQKLISMTCYIMFPLMTGLMVCSREIVILLLTEKWLPSVQLIQIICIYYAMNPLRQLCVQLNYAAGNYKYNLRVECTRTALTITAVGITTRFREVPVIAWPLCSSCVAVITVIMYLFSIKCSLKYSVVSLLMTAFPSVMLTIAAMVPAIALKLFPLSPILYLFCAVLSASAVYAALSLLTRNNCFHELLDAMKRLIKRA